MRTAPGVTIRALTPRSRSSRPGDLLTNLIASVPKRALNFAQPVWGSAVTSITASPDGEPGSGGQVPDADVQVDVELVARERPALAAAGDRLRRPRVHQRQLREGIGCPVGPAAAPAASPDVSDEALVEIQHSLVEHLALVRGGAPDDQLDRALGGR